MTLREYLEKNVGMIVKIGAQRGSSFFFCDEITDNTIEIIQKMSDEQYKKLTNNYQKLNAKYTELKSFEDEARHFHEFINGLMESGDIKDAGRTFITKHKGVLKTTKDQLLRANTFIQMWKPFLDRQIMEKYKSIREDKTMIVLITGIENGSYWNVKEYRNAINGGVENGSESDIDYGSAADQKSDDCIDS